MLKRVLLSVVVLACAAFAQNSSTPIFHVRDLKAGMHGVGRTVFEGDKLQEFQVEILGVVKNMGPRQTVVLAKLSGGPLADTGVLQGMSGSPVYIDGKLLGAVALGFPFSKTALAGITPIEEMIAQQHRAEAESKIDNTTPSLVQLTAASGTLEILTPPSAVKSPFAGDSYDSDLPGMNLPELHTPLSFSGFSSRAVEHFLPELKGLGLEPMLSGGFSSGGNAEYKHEGRPSDLQAGQMISVELIRGDLNVAADGTVTYIDGNNIYAFGHRFLSAGGTALPFTKASVVALMSGYMTSFKISNPGESMGVIQADESQGIYGTFGGAAPMIPVRVRLHGPDGSADKYEFEMVDHRFLSPLLLRLAVYATLDATQRGIGPATLGLHGAIHLHGAPDIRVNDMFAGDVNGPDALSAAAATPLSYLYDSGLSGIHVNGIDLDVTSSPEKRVLTLEQVWSDHREVRPGDSVEVTAVLRADDGTEVAKRMPVTLPASLAAGPISILVGEGNALNQLELRQIQQGFAARELPQLVRAINHIRRNNQLYLRVMRPDAAYVLYGEQLPAPPPSLARVLASDPSIDDDIPSLRSSTVLDTQSDPLPFVISGMKTITLDVKEN